MKIILLIIGASFSLVAYTQEVGLGQFKINVTTIDIVKRLSDSVHVKIKTTTKFAMPSDASKEKTKSIILLIKDTSQMADADPYSLISAKVYLIDFLKIGPLLARNIYLTFLNDTLCNFQCDGTKEIKEALSYKYNAPKTETTSKDVQCQNRIGNKFDYKEESFTDTWHLPEPYHVYQYLNSYYNSECQNRIDYFLSMSDKKKTAKITLLDYFIESRVRKRAEGEKLSKYKNL